MAFAVSASAKRATNAGTVDPPCSKSSWNQSKIADSFRVPEIGSNRFLRTSRTKPRVAASSIASSADARYASDRSAGQLVEAQTIANVYLALEGDLEIVPILNKIDLPGADVDRVATEVENTIGIDCSDAIAASAKVGIGIDEILEAIVQKVPAPAPKRSAPLRALIFDSYYDAYVGVVSQIRVVDGDIEVALG